MAVDFDTAAVAPTAAPVGVVANQQADISPFKPIRAADPGITMGGMGGGGGFGGAMPGMALPPAAPMSEAAPAPAAEPAPAAAEFAPPIEDLAKSIDEPVAMDALKAEEKSKDRFAGRRGSELRGDEGRMEQKLNAFEEAEKVQLGREITQQERLWSRLRQGVKLVTSPPNSPMILVSSTLPSRPQGC